VLTRTHARGIPVGIACACVSSLLLLTPLGRSLDDWFTDACFVIRGTRASKANVVIIAIEDETLDHWKRPLPYISPELARVVLYADNQGARAIGLDVLVPESLSGLPEIEEGIGDARLLGEAIKATNKVVLPEYYDKIHDKLRRPLIQWSIDAALSKEGARFGFLNLSEDDDQFIRRQLLMVATEQKPELSFALALFLRSRNEPPHPEVRGSDLILGDRRVPLDSEGAMRVNYVGPPKTFPVLSLGAVLESASKGQPTPLLKDATVIIGLTGAGHLDQHPTPFANGSARLMAGQPGSLTFGSEIHAHTYATLHDGQFLTRPWWIWPFPWAILAGGTLAAVFMRINLTRGALVLLLSLGVLAVGGYAVFRYFGWVMSTVPLAATIALTYFVVFARRWSRLRRMMAVVKSESITRALEADPRRLDPGGELRELTALFADIRGFTTFSERCGNDPRKVVALLNAYFERVVPILESEGGTVASFMGDGIMVLFGAPIHQPDHAARAVRAAVRMARTIHQNAPLWAKLECPGMRVGIGIHSGPAVIGAVGGRNRLDYTAIGDTINTASRVEGKTKALAADVLITSSTLDAIRDVPALFTLCQTVDHPVEVAGRVEPVYLSRVEIDPPHLRPDA
jgi:adenylate cyclase